MMSMSTVAAEENAKLAKAVDLHTISRITQIWSDRLQLISVYVGTSSSMAEFVSNTNTQIRRIYAGQFLHFN